MLIRLATQADIPEMHGIRLRVRENQLADPAVVQPHHYVPMLTESGRGWVAERDGAIAGFAIADLSRASVWALFVDPAFEGQGIGRMLHDVMLDWLIDSGVRLVGLTTEPGTRAERLYAAAGWRQAGDTGGEVRYEMTAIRWRARPRVQPK